MSRYLEAPSGIDVWAEETGWRPSQGHGCLHWVGRGRCNVMQCLEDRNEHRWMDHVSTWIKDGRRLMVCQPYYLGNAELRDLLEAADRFNLEIELHGRGFYGHGSIAIELKPRQAKPPAEPPPGVMVSYDRL